MKYDVSLGGAWLDADKLKDGMKVKIVSECEKRQSRFTNKDGSAKTENVVKVRLQGDDNVYNARLNWTTIYGLIAAFGDESKEWIGKTLSIETLESLVGDTVRTILYFVPEGFELRKNSEKKMEIAKIGKIGDEQPIPQEDVPEIDIDGIPF